MVVTDAVTAPVPQHKEALHKANATRFWRSRLKSDVRAGQVSAADVLEAPHEFADAMKVFDLLNALPRFGRHRVRTLLKDVGVLDSVLETKTIGGLTPRQRGELIKALRAGPYRDFVPDANVGFSTGQARVEA